MDVYYIKKDDQKVYLTNINTTLDDWAELTVSAKNRTMEEVKYIFSNLPDLTIYKETIQEDMVESEETIYIFLPKVTKLNKIEYNPDENGFMVRLTEPNDLEERVTELEDAVNYILFELFGGDE